MSIKDMKILAAEMGILTEGITKSTLLYELSSGKKPNENNIQNNDGYAIIKQLGIKGRDGNVFLVKTKNGKQYAKKQFRKNRSVLAIKTEAKLQKKASKIGVSPEVKEYNLNSKYIIMDVIDGKSMYMVMRENKGKLNSKQQKALLKIFSKLDNIGVFHKDPNPLNFIFDKDMNLHIIDFGFAEIINPKRHGDAPNSDQMTLGLLIKFKTLFPGVEYSTMKKSLKPGLLQILNGE